MKSNFKAYFYVTRPFRNNSDNLWPLSRSHALEGPDSVFLGQVCNERTDRLLVICYKLLGAEWCKYAPVQHTNTISDNGISCVRHPAINWTNAAIEP